ncbi:hypothetical protein J0794_29870 [Bacillus paranthracis]|nr:hypothetical protein [Bacillus paranthracis]
MMKVMFITTKWNEIFNKFNAWSEDGKFYKKQGLFGFIREISKEEFHKLLLDNKVTHLSFSKSNQSIGISELIGLYGRLREQNKSLHKERVIIQTTQEKQENIIVDGIQKASFTATYRMYTESGKLMDTITLEVTEMTGKMVEMGVYLPEVYRCAYQLSRNGILATESDEDEFFDTLKSLKILNESEV